MWTKIFRIICQPKPKNIQRPQQNRIQKINKLIEKCHSLKYLYKTIRNKIKPQTANTFVDKNNAIVSNDKQIANEFKKYFETTYSSSIRVDENFVQNLISKEGGNKNNLKELHINMNNILKSLKNFDPRKSQGF